MPRPESALLFDLDGTLVDTYEINYRSYRDSLAEQGRACTREQFAPHFGQHWRAFLPILADSNDAAYLKHLHRRKQELYARHLDAVRINQPLVTLLRSARPNWGTGLVTTASRLNVDLLLDHLGLAQAFDHIVTGDDVTNTKPAPDGYQLCLQRMGAIALGSLAFEDSPTGIAAARAAGLQVLIVSGFGPAM